MAKDTDFLYVSARIKFLETKLLGKSAIDRLLDASGIDDALKALSDTEYGSDIAEMENIYDFEKVLEHSMLRTIDTLKESFKNHELIRFFNLKNDYHNLKVILKGNILGTEVKDYFSHLGEVSPDEIQKYAQGDNSASIPDNFKEAYDKALEIYEATKDPQKIDLFLDQALFKEMEKIAEQSKIPFLKVYLAALSDITNIKTMLRLKKADSDIRTLESALVVGGSLKSDFFKEIFTGSTQSIIEAFSSTPYYEIVEEGLTAWESTGSPLVLEKMADNYLMALARKGLYTPFGPETVVGYMAARDNELKLLRIILVGKINGISSDMIRERLRDVYI
ncbi:MAG TPA: V-type ATP synthase subunit C [Tepidanaerobacter syntrophicus]|uniref:V-type ATP synthase subunit C n=1 Tax=Tepidanaerobacter syntrophicus TaxID=224999 RepID=UPI001768F597|nr:V-type ATP synthase subunit C [Tepidanaerobacter syntrophicus]HHV84108.1 V-type ATP synthase subunit C [Tepidanaerobacter syntrophicus]